MTVASKQHQTVHKANHREILLERPPSKADGHPLEARLLLRLFSPKLEVDCCVVVVLIGVLLKQ